MNSNPLVSIIIPCYNQGCFLEETLESVILQTYNNWECIIVNDGSTDNTEVVAMKYTKMDNRFKYIYQSNKGLSATRNKGISNSSGKYILPLDSDDKIGNTYIEKAVSVLEANSKVEIVYCKAKLFGIQKGEWILPDYSIEQILGENCIFCSAVYRKVTYDLVGGYKENMKYGFEDWDFWLSIIENKKDLSIHKINEVLFYYRVRRNSMARSLDSEKMYNMRKQIWDNHRKLYADNFTSPIYSFEYRLIKQSKEYRIGQLMIKLIFFFKRHRIS